MFIQVQIMSQAEGSRGGTPSYDSLEVERRRFKSLQDASSASHKQAMQQLYKKQLDYLYEQKLKFKQAERTKQEIERRQFNQQVEQGIEAERNKQVSYKNYYNMLMNNQSHNQEIYVSPFSKRDNLKDALIQKGVDEDLKRYRQSEQEARMRQAQRRTNYKNDLMRQIEERRNKQMMERERLMRQKQDFQRTSKVPKDIQRYQKERKKDEVEKYRADLDLMSKGVNAGDIPRKQSQESRAMEIRPQFHNVLTNPMPYNIQNPYILRQMGQGNNPSYLAMKGSQNLKQLF